MSTHIGRALDSGDYPAFPMSTAAGMLGVTPAFLRRLGAHGLIDPDRSEGGHRRYSRNELVAAGRAREVVDEGFDLVAACRIVLLEQQLATANAVIEDLRRRLAAQPPPSGESTAAA